jgi:hypothetical protein
MKTLFVLLLGFGGAYPMTCNKKQHKPKQESNLKFEKILPSSLVKNNDRKYITLPLIKITIEVYS